MKFVKNVVPLIGVYVSVCVESVSFLIISIENLSIRWTFHVRYEVYVLYIRRNYKDNDLAECRKREADDAQDTRAD